MRRQIMTLLLGFAIVWALLWRAGVNCSVITQAQGVTPTPAVSPTPTTVPSPPGALTYGEALKTYENVATEAIKAAERVLEIAKWLIGSIIALLGIAGSLIAYLVNKAQTASELAKEAKTAATEASQSARISAERVETLSGRVVSLGEAVQITVGKAQAQLEALNTELERTKKLAERDRMALRRSLELIQIDEHGMAVFGDDAERKWKSKIALIEMSRRSDPIVRWRCVRIFGALEGYDEAVFRRLEEIAESDSDRGVKREAAEAMERLKSRKRAE